MKFVIEVEEFYLEEEELSAALKNYVKDQVLHEIFKKMQQHIEGEITLQVKNSVEILMKEKIAFEVNEFIRSGKLVSRWKSEPISVTDLVAKTFEDLTVTRNISEAVEKQAKVYAESIKQRYDVLFATQIVQKIQAAGLLKDEASALLFNAPKP